MIPTLKLFKWELERKNLYSLDDPMVTTALDQLKAFSNWGGQVLFGWLDGLVGMTPGHPSLYQALRVSQAQIAPQSLATRARAIALAILLLPFAALGGLTEILMRRAGTVYIEARRG